MRGPPHRSRLYPPFLWTSLLKISREPPLQPAIALFSSVCPSNGHFYNLLILLKNLECPGNPSIPLPVLPRLRWRFRCAEPCCVQLPEAKNPNLGEARECRIQPLAHFLRFSPASGGGPPEEFYGVAANRSISTPTLVASGKTSNFSTRTLTERTLRSSRHDPAISSAKVSTRLI